MAPRFAELPCFGTRQVFFFFYTLTVNFIKSDLKTFHSISQSILPSISLYISFRCLYHKISPLFTIVYYHHVQQQHGFDFKTSN